MSRYLILFAREPGREAREKGFGASGDDLFATFAAGWLDAARQAKARLVIATPPEDRVAWNRLFSARADILWITQHGACFGERLEGVARRASQLPGHAVLVGGDAAPAAAVLAQAFEALDRGAEAVLGPAVDGGVSLVALKPPDVDLLATLAPRQRGVCATLQCHLRQRGRSIVLVDRVPDVDGRRSLRLLLRRTRLAPEVASLARQVLGARRFAETRRGGWNLLARAVPVLRGPPLPA